MGLVHPDGILSSLNVPNENRSMNNSPHATKRANSSDIPGGSGSSFFSGNVSNVFANGEACDGSLESSLDFHETAPYTAVQKSMLSSSTMQQGMAIHWIGPAPSVILAPPSPHTRSSPSNRASSLQSPSSMSSNNNNSKNMTSINNSSNSNNNNNNKYVPPISPGKSSSSNGMYPPSTLLRNASMRSNPNGPNLRVLTPGVGYSGSSTPLASPHMSCSISRTGSMEISSLDKRALNERLQAVAAYPSIELGRRVMGVNVLSRTRSHSLSRSPKDNVLDDFDGETEASERDQTLVDKQIEELEAELEIARLEAKLLKLRNAKGKNITKSGTQSQNFSRNESTDNSVLNNSGGIVLEPRDSVSEKGNGERGGGGNVGGESS